MDEIELPAERGGGPLVKDYVISFCAMTQRYVGHRVALRTRLKVIAFFAGSRMGGSVCLVDRERGRLGKRISWWTSVDRRRRSGRKQRPSVGRH